MTFYFTTVIELLSISQHYIALC